MTEDEAKAVIFETVVNPSAHSADRVSAACRVLAHYLPTEEPTPRA